MPSARSWATPRILANLMHPHNPHFLLYSESAIDGESRPTWKFVLQAVGDDEHFAAADTEPGARSSRLELLAVVRGLEALDQPSRVTLLTRSRYVRRGIRRELNHWREPLSSTRSSAVPGRMMTSGLTAGRRADAHPPTEDRGARETPSARWLLQSAAFGRPWCHRLRRFGGRRLRGPRN
jgi:hypothetical protein